MVSGMMWCNDLGFPGENQFEKDTRVGRNVLYTLTSVATLPLSSQNFP